MTIISRTPVRISFFGGGIDYPDFYQYQTGAVLGTTIDQYLYVRINPHTEQVDKPMEHPSVRACLHFKQISGNVDIQTFSDLPARTGLGSSSSFTVGFLHALSAFCGQSISKQRLAEEACHVEQHLIQELAGSQDPFHAAYGGFNAIQFSPDQIQVRPLALSEEKSALLEQHLMVFYTGPRRHERGFLQEQIENTRNRSNDIYLKTMLGMVREAEQILDSSSLDRMPIEIGTLLHESWEVKKKLSSKISNAGIDQAYAAARAAGAYGGKLCGAGSGGFLALLVPPRAQTNVREALQGLLEVAIRFEKEGSKIVYKEDRA